MNGRILRIGAGAGYSGDRIEPAVELAEHGRLDYLIFECLAERTIALAQLAKLQNPALGYDPLLCRRMQAVLGPCVRNGVKIITNMGAANPVAAAEKIVEVARAAGFSGLKVAAITGDDVLGHIQGGDHTLMESGQPLNTLGDRIISANAYLGAAPITQALAAGADIVITGRVADPALFLAPLIHEFGWQPDDWPLMGRGTMIGHLLECAGQVTGGYFADPGIKDVAGLAQLGFPIAEVTSSGDVVITKVAGSGGQVTPATCQEQLLYEIGDPRCYMTPDVTADFSGVEISEVGFDRVSVRGASGRARPKRLKVSVGYHAGYAGEGQISYAGPGALGRGRLALEILRERFRIVGIEAADLRFELIGVDAILGHRAIEPRPEPYEVRVRVAGRCETLAVAEAIGNEVEALYTNGPAGGGGATKSARPVVAVMSVLLPRELVQPQLQYQVT